MVVWRAAAAGTRWLRVQAVASEGVTVTGGVIGGDFGVFGVTEGVWG